MMVLWKGYAFAFLSYGASNPCQGMDCPEWEFQWKLEGVGLHIRGCPNFLRDYVAEKARLGIYFFLSLGFLDGIKCTLGVCLGTMSQ